MDFYSEDQDFINKSSLGTVIFLLRKGDQRNIVLEDIQAFEVKQGSFVDDVDRIKFITS